MGSHYTGTDLSPLQSELATSLRIPFITSSHPRWYYVTAVVVEDDLYGAAVPTDDELRMVASFNDQYREHWYRDSYKQKMREFAPFDIDGGAVGRYLIKYAKTGGWGFRRHTWQYGPTFVPTWKDKPQPLVVVLDRCMSFGDEPSPRWEQWKTEHADVFAAGGVR